MTFEALDLPLRLPCCHFFYACLYSTPRPGLLLGTVPRVFALICSSFRFVRVVLGSFAPPVSHTISKVSMLNCSPCCFV